MHLKRFKWLLVYNCCLFHHSSSIPSEKNFPVGPPDERLANMIGVSEPSDAVFVPLCELISVEQYPGQQEFIRIDGSILEIILVIAMRAHLDVP